MSFAGEAIKREREDGDHETRLRVHVTHHATATSTRALLARCIFRGWLKDCQHYYISTFPSSLADFAIFVFNVDQEVFLCAVWWGRAFRFAVWIDHSVAIDSTQ